MLGLKCCGFSISEINHEFQFCVIGPARQPQNAYSTPQFSLFHRHRHYFQSVFGSLDWPCVSKAGQFASSSRSLTLHDWRRVSNETVSQDDRNCNTEVVSFRNTLLLDPTKMSIKWIASFLKYLIENCFQFLEKSRSQHGCPNSILVRKIKMNNLREFVNWFVSSSELFLCNKKLRRVNQPPLLLSFKRHRRSLKPSSVSMFRTWPTSRQRYLHK